LQANAILALRRIGLDGAVTAAGRIATVACVRTAEGRVLSRLDLLDIEREMGAPAVALHRATLQDLLVSTLDREALHLDSEAVGYTVRPDGVTLELADGRRIEGALLIGTPSSPSHPPELPSGRSCGHCDEVESPLRHSSRPRPAP
jgi:2-polyprenyl-6-methoxyphenol hydroxylase-like FAD-dependent oxidoreductase